MPRKADATSALMHARRVHERIPGSTSTTPSPSVTVVTPPFAATFPSSSSERMAMLLGTVSVSEALSRGTAFPTGTISVLLLPLGLVTLTTKAPGALAAKRCLSLSTRGVGFPVPSGLTLHVIPSASPPPGSSNTSPTHSQAPRLSLSVWMSGRVGSTTRRRAVADEIESPQTHRNSKRHSPSSSVFAPSPSAQPVLALSHDTLLSTTHPRSSMSREVKMGALLTTPSSSISHVSPFISIDAVTCGATTSSLSRGQPQNTTTAHTPTATITSETMTRSARRPFPALNRVICPPTNFCFSD